MQVLIATGTYRGVRRLQRHLLERRTLAEFRTRLEFFRTMIKGGDLCFDIGANKGEVTEVLLVLGAQVVAFEPQLHLVQEIEERCARVQSLTAVACAMSDKAGFASFYERQEHGKSSIRADWPGTIATRRTVPTLPLDSAIREFGRPYYCKIDVEGSEKAVLSGLTQSVPLCSFEYHRTPSNIQDTLQVLGQLRKLGGQRVNITPVETPRFRFERWMPINDFLTWFPDSLPADLSAAQGDIFVATQEAHGRWFKEA